MTIRRYRLAHLFIFFLLQGLPLVKCQTCPAEGTPSDMLGPFYVAESPVSILIGPEDELQEPTNRLVVSGNVLSARDCTKGVAGVTMEIWYAGPEGYRDDEYRGMFVTEECGKYSYTQTFPFLYTGRPLHVHIRASRGTEELLVTQMYFMGQDFGFQTSRSMQTVDIVEAEDGSRSVRFDIYLDVEGDAVENCATPLFGSSAPVANDVSPPLASSVVPFPSPLSDVANPAEALTGTPSDENLSSPIVSSFANLTLTNFVHSLASVGCLLLFLAQHLI